MRTRFGLSILILLALSGAAHARRVSCAECVLIPACEAADDATVVFVGEVITAGAKRDPQTVRFRVVERFRGVAANQREITADIQPTGIDTVFITSRGRYLVYAREVSPDKWDTTCSRTKPLRTTADEDELTELRHCVRR